MNSCIKFHIPDFYYFNNLNQKLINIMKEYPSYFRNGITIGSIYGSFPNVIWNGGRPCLENNFDAKNIPVIINQFNSQGIPLRFTFTNSKLNENHLTNKYCNYILKVANNGFNEIIINNHILEEYLRKTYPSYKYILSTTVGLRDYDSISRACEKYDMVVIDYNENKNYELLNKLERKDRIELLINESCIPNCKYRKHHYDTIALQQLNRSLDNGFVCPNNKLVLENGLLGDKSPTIITDIELYSTYIGMGFTNFKISGRTYPEMFAIINIVNYMVKQEYKNLIYAKLKN